MEETDRKLTGIDAVEWMIANKGKVLDAGRNVRAYFDGKGIVLTEFSGGDVETSRIIPLRSAIKMTFRHLKPITPTKTRPPYGCSWYHYAASPSSSIYLSDSARKVSIAVPMNKAARKRLLAMTEACIAASLEVYGK